MAQRNLAETDSPELATVSIQLPGAGIELRRFLSYEIHFHFLTPSDSWSCEVDLDELSRDEKAAIVPRAGVIISIAGQPQLVGYIDNIETRFDRDGGTIIRIEGRDWLSPSVDSQIDPRIQFGEGQNLGDILTKVFQPFFGTGTGLAGSQITFTDNELNRNVQTGRVYGTPTSKKGKPLKSFVLHQLKPYPNEGAFSFASRICQRQGLWIWPGVTFGNIIVGQPNFEQDTRYQFIHRLDNPLFNNIINGTVHVNGSDQPSVILAGGSGGGGEFAKSQLKSMAVNPFVHADISSVLNSYPKVKAIALPLNPNAVWPDQFLDPVARPMYLYDSEAHTQDQLDAFVRRELSLRTRKSLSVTYTIEGHRLGGLPIAIDTIASIDDDRPIGMNTKAPGLHTNMWILSCSYRKSAQIGTMTTVEMIRPYTIIF